MRSLCFLMLCLSIMQFLFDLWNIFTEGLDVIKIYLGGRSRLNIGYHLRQLKLLGGCLLSILKSLFLKKSKFGLQLSY
jgi:hypothetical protein